MNRIKFLTLALVVVMGFAAVNVAAPRNVAAQDANVIIEATFGSGPVNLNPVLCSDTACTRITTFLFPTIVGIDPVTTAFVPGATSAIAKDWKISDDGKVYTITLRTDEKWSDGTPITSKDVAYGWNVVKDPESPSAASFVAGVIDSVETPDDTTVIVTFKEAACTAFSNIAAIPLVPSHLFTDVKNADLKTNAFNTAPTVSAGVFKFKEFRTGERTVLEADPSYVDAIGGKVVPAGFVYNVVPDQTVLVERFLAGEMNVIDTPPVNRRADVRAAAEKGDVKAFSFAGNSWDYLAMNNADPANPKNGRDDKGELLDQGKHPIFGDVNVRKAISLAIDVDSIIQGAVFGEGQRMSSFLIPTSWAHNPDLAPLAYDPEAAAKMLDEAGWKVGTDGIREKDGVKLTFKLITNQGNSRRASIGSLVKDQLKAIGVEVDFQTIDFNVVIDQMNAQTFDAIILGWRNSFPDDPDATQLFGTAGDVVGSGSNFTSWYNEKFEDLNAKALSLPGCDQAERAKLYQEMEQIFQDEVPYVPLFVQNGMYAASSTVEGFDPKPSQLYWNVDTWAVKSK